MRKNEIISLINSHSSRNKSIGLHILLLGETIFKLPLFASEPATPVNHTLYARGHSDTMENNKHEGISGRNLLSIIGQFSSDEELGASEVINDPSYVPENERKDDAVRIHHTVFSPRRDDAFNAENVEAELSAIPIRKEPLNNPPMERKKLPLKQRYLAEKNEENAYRLLENDDYYDYEEVPVCSSRAHGTNGNRNEDLERQKSPPLSRSNAKQCIMQMNSPENWKNFDADFGIVHSDSMRLTDIDRQQLTSIDRQDSKVIPNILAIDDDEMAENGLENLDEKTSCKLMDSHKMQPCNTKHELQIDKAPRVCWIVQTAASPEEDRSKIHKTGESSISSFQTFTLIF